MAADAVSGGRKTLSFGWTGTIARFLAASAIRRFVFLSAGLTGILLLERLLRLLDFVVAYHTSPLTLATMLVMLTPHYLALSMPAAALLSLLMTVLALRETGELHAIVSWGVSLRQVTRLLTVLCALLAVGLALMSGFLNPYARYAFREVAHKAKLVSVSSVVKTNPRFWRTDDYDVYVPSWSNGPGQNQAIMQHPLLLRKKNKAYDVIEVTRGRVVDNTDKGVITLQLRQGRELRHEITNGKPFVVHFESLSIPIIREEGGEFRARGADDRELTLPELRRETMAAGDSATAARVELHMRLIRALSVIVFPILALAVCVGPPRQAPRYGPALAVAGVLTYHFMLYGLEGLAVHAGGLAVIVLWAPFGLLAGFVYAIFRRRTGKLSTTNGFGSPPSKRPPAPTPTAEAVS